MNNKREELKNTLKGQINMQDFSIKHKNKNLIISNYEIVDLFCKYGKEEEIEYICEYLKNDEALKSSNLKMLLKMIGDNIFYFALMNNCLVSIEQ